MGSFGERMRRERETRGITLESISGSTKIGAHILKALENDEFDKLPGGVFKKGFVRSYARILGMDEEQVLKEFIAVAGDPEQPLPDPPARRRPGTVQPQQRRSWGGVATVLVCATALLFGAWKAVSISNRATWSGPHWTRSQPAMTPAESVTAKHASFSSPQTSEQPAGVPATDQAENVASATLQPASRTTRAPATELIPAAATTRTDGFVILIKAKEPAWVSITADDKPFLEGILKRTQKVHAYLRVVLKTNNAGALAVSRNGRRLPPLGDHDQQTTVTFAPDGITHTFTDPSEN